MNPAELVRLVPLMERTSGSSDIAVGVIDGPVWLDHPAFSGSRIRQTAANSPAACQTNSSAACLHGTFVLGMLAAHRGSGAPAICPACSFVIRPIFSETPSQNSPAFNEDPSATPAELATAILDVVRAGARIINLSAAMAQPYSKGDRLTEALDYAAHRGVLVVAAAGNQGTVGSSAITGHPWVIPVIACDLQGRPTQESNLAASIGRHGLAAPGENIASISADGRVGTFTGTSAAAPFVTGAIALLWSLFPKATASQIKLGVARADGHVRRTIAPPLLNAWSAYAAVSRN
jgi:subtilisin family serine protease